MPEGTKVDKVYKALRREGKSEESAAKIAQFQTGEALATGKPPKHENSGEGLTGLQIATPEMKKRYEELYQRFSANGRRGLQKLTPTEHDEFLKLERMRKNGWKFSNTHFQNGRNRARLEIENRMKFGNVNAELVKALEKADAFGYADRYKRGLMTEEEVKKYLKTGERIKPTEKELAWTKDRSPKIFGYSYDEIAHKQGIQHLR